MRYLIVLCALLLLSGCGGGSSSSGGVPIITFPPVNQDRVGFWRGKQAETISHQGGEMALSIFATNTMTGTWTTDTGTVWTITGTIEPVNAFPVTHNAMLTFTAPGEVAKTPSGPLLVDLSGHLSGRLIELEHVPFPTLTTPVITQFDIDLIRQ